MNIIDASIRVIVIVVSVVSCLVGFGFTYLFLASAILMPNNQLMNVQLLFAMSTGILTVVSGGILHNSLKS